MFGPGRAPAGEPFAHELGFRVVWLKHELSTSLRCERGRTQAGETRAARRLISLGKIDPSVRATSSPRPSPGVLDGEAKHPNS